MSQLTDSPEWKKLEKLSQKEFKLRDAFAAKPDRAQKLTKAATDWKIDYSKQLLDEEIMSGLLDLAKSRQVEKIRDDMFSGKRINSSEDRAVLHVLLRAPKDSKIGQSEDGAITLVHGELAKMRGIAKRIRERQFMGATGRPIDTIVNIGIGGSDLGPVMATEALKHYSDRDLTMRFISNVDPADFYEQTRDLNPETTLFIVASKSFTTMETMANAEAAKTWLQDSVGEQAVFEQMIALSTNHRAVAEFGIDPENVFEFWDWVGGRYSLWSAIGLSIMIAIGPDNFSELLAGAHEMDRHFKEAELKENLPVVLGLIGVWNRNFLGYSTEAVLPYSQYLHRLPAYLQQANMESNGKSVTASGESVDYDTGPVIWGEPGTNGQHAFMQLIHQGTSPVPVEFVGFEESLHDIGGQHRMLMANMQAQAEALAFGKTTEELELEKIEKPLVNHKTMPGNRPSTTLTTAKLTPKALGQLIALYEHKIFVQGVIWGINSFDQWGVELGKNIANQLLSDEQS